MSSEAQQNHHHAPHTDADPLIHPHIPRIQPKDLAEVLQKASSESSDVKRPLIIDVRDPGTTGGFIRGAVNFPKPDFDDDAKVDALVEKIKDQPEIVFHCQHSQQRGPKAALQFLERLEKQLQEGDKKPDVKVLKGGFHQFSEEYGTDEQLVDQRPLGDQ